MSEHIQPAPNVADSRSESEHTRAASAPQSTPGVSHEPDGFSFWLIVKVGGGMIVTAAIIHVVVWWLLMGLEKVNGKPFGDISELAAEDAARPLDQRLDNVPPPHLEGIERESSLILVRTDKGEEKRFLAALDVRVHLGDNERASLFELREGQRVTLTYYLPNGVGGGVGVVTAVTSPPMEKAGKKDHTEELPDSPRSLDGTILKIEPRSIVAARAWAEVQKDRYGWTDRKQDIVHIPVENAMETVLQSKEFRTDANKKKSAGRLALPTRSSSGRAAAGGK